MNIIEAVKYLREHPDAIIKRSNGRVKLNLINWGNLTSHGTPLNIIDILEDWILQEPEKKQRTHREIMSNWFKWLTVWEKVTAYNSNNVSPYYFEGQYRKIDFFTNLEMKTDDEIREME